MKLDDFVILGFVYTFLKDVKVELTNQNKICQVTGYIWYSVNPNFMNPIIGGLRLIDQHKMGIWDWFLDSLFHILDIKCWKY